MNLKKTFGHILLTASLGILSQNAIAVVRVVDFNTDANGNEILNGQFIGDEYSAWDVTISGCLRSQVQNASEGTCNSSTNYATAFRTTSVSDDTPLKAGESIPDTQFTSQSAGDPDLQFTVVTDDEGNTVYATDNNGNVLLDADGKPIPAFRSNNGTNYSPLRNHGNFTHRTIEAGRGDAPGNVLILQEDLGNPYNPNCNTDGCLRPDDALEGGFFVFDFERPVNILNLDFIDTEENSNERSIYFHVSDNGTLLITDDGLDGPNRSVPVVSDGGFVRIPSIVNSQSVTRLVVNLPGSGAIDNLVFHDNVPATSTGTTEVPAPGSSILVLMGLCGLLLRHRIRDKQYFRL